MPVDEVRLRWRNLRAERERREERRYIDIAVSWERKSGDTIAFFGGVWDQVERRFTGKDPERCALIRFNDSQIEFARWAAWWAQERRERRRRPFAGLFAFGDRGSGKTYAAVAILGTLQVEFPTLEGKSSIGFLVSRSHAERAEIDRYFGELFPASWYVYREWPQHVYRWVTGATTTNVSADDPTTLKRGTVDFLLINEAALVGHKVPFFGFARLKDHGGLGLLTANPPDSLKGEWVLKIHRKAELAKKNGRDYPLKFLRIMSDGNENLDRDTADQVTELLTDLDPRAALADGKGLMLPIGDKAYFRFNEDAHVRTPPADLPDITRRFTAARLGRAFDYIGGVDFQGSPHHAAVVCKIYGSMKEPVLCVVDEFIAEQSVEDDLLDVVEAAGYTPEILCWVGDASGQWQDGKHARNGRDSFQIFRGRRWHVMPPAEKRTERSTFSKNPPVEKRVGLVNTMFGGPLPDGQDGPPLPTRLYAAEQNPKIVEALRECPWVRARYGGKPVGFYSHITDALGYVCWWVFPTPGRQLSSDEPIAIVDDPLVPALYS